MARNTKLYFACNFDYTGDRNLFTGEQINEGREAYFADVVAIGRYDNILTAFQHFGGIITANLMPSKKAAQELCDAWNETYKHNGTYAF